MKVMNLERALEIGFWNAPCAVIPYHRRIDYSEANETLRFVEHDLFTWRAFVH
jgi:hypothetical protein